MKSTSQQLAESRDNIIRVITKKPSFRTKAERAIGKITLKHASHQLAQYWDKVVRVTSLIMFDPLCILISFILFYLLLFR